MTPRIGVLPQAEEAGISDGFSEVLTEMLLVAVVMLAIASAVILLTVGAT